MSDDYTIDEDGFRDLTDDDFKIETTIDWQGYKNWLIGWGIFMFIVIPWAIGIITVLNLIFF